MLKVTKPIVRETAVIDPETNQPIVIKIDAPGLVLGLRRKGARQTVAISILDVYMAAKNSRGEDFKALAPTFSKPKPKPVDPDIAEVIREVLSYNSSLHMSQVRQQLQKRGIEVSKKITGTILKLMTDTNQVKHDDRMYYSLAKV